MMIKIFSEMSLHFLFPLLCMYSLITLSNSQTLEMLNNTDERNMMASIKSEHFVEKEQIINYKFRTVSNQIKNLSLMAKRFMQNWFFFLLSLVGQKSFVRQFNVRFKPWQKAIRDDFQFEQKMQRKNSASYFSFPVRVFVLKS